METKTEILFVDDDAHLLKGLRRSLYTMHKEWHMAFAPSSQEALLVMERQYFDVVISDMRMPGMDGSDLLMEVKKQYPQAVRVLLSGQADLERIIQTVLPTHQYLSKPCEAEKLKALITRTCRLRDLLPSPELKQLVSDIGNIFCQHKAFEKLKNELEQETPDLKAISEIILSDICMSVKILQIANSAFFGTGQTFFNAAQAITNLGIDILRKLFYSVAIFLYTPSAATQAYIEKINTRSLRIANTAKNLILLDSGRREDAEIAFTVGQLQEIGKAILALYRPDEYVQVLNLIDEHNLSDREAEQHIFGATHAEVGTYLLGLWGMPLPIVEAIAFHHGLRETSSVGSVFSSILHAANTLDSEIAKSSQEQQEEICRGYLAQVKKEIL